MADFLVAKYQLRQANPAVWAAERLVVAKFAIRGVPAGIESEHAARAAGTPR
ncbi:MAG: hypothetical protein ACRDVP_02205 [Acidimicrobiales bacterium]